MMKSLGEFLKVNKSLHALNLTCNRITDKGIQQVAPYFDGNASIKYLNLSINKLTKKSTSTLVDIIKSSSLEVLELSESSEIKKEQLYLHLVANSLKNKSTKLECVGMSIDDQGVEKILKLFKKYGIDHLTEINLSGNQIKPDGAILLFNALVQCKSLEVVYFGWNPINDTSIDAFIDLLKCCPNIKRIDLSGAHKYEQQKHSFRKVGVGKLTNEAVSKLSDFITGNKMIQYLDLTFNDKINSKSLPSLINMVSKSNLQELEIENKGKAFLNELILALVSKKLQQGTLKEISFEEKFVWLF